MGNSGDLRFVSDGVPYWYIGDSHAGVGTLFFEGTDGRHVVARSVGIWRFVAADVVDGDGIVSDSLMQVFRRLGAFHSGPSFKPIAGLPTVRTRYGNQFRNEQLQLTSFANDAAYIMHVGEINTRYLLQQLGEDRIDFETPFPTAHLDDLPPYDASRVISAVAMMGILLQTFDPLFKGLRILQNAALNSLFLHSLPPPAVDDHVALRVYGHPSAAKLRYKLIMMVNYMYRAACSELGIGFIDTWDFVTRSGLLDDAYSLDGLHLNRNHSILSVQEVDRQFTARRNGVLKENKA